jgi:hypothetical protein
MGPTAIDYRLVQLDGEVATRRSGIPLVQHEVRDLEPSCRSGAARTDILHAVTRCALSPHSGASPVAELKTPFATEPPLVLWPYTALAPPPAVTPWIPSPPPALVPRMAGVELPVVDPRRRNWYRSPPNHCGHTPRAPLRSIRSRRSGIFPAQNTSLTVVVVLAAFQPPATTGEGELDTAGGTPTQTSRPPGLIRKSRSLTLGAPNRRASLQGPAEFAALVPVHAFATGPGGRRFPAIRTECHGPMDVGNLRLVEDTATQDPRSCESSEDLAPADSNKTGSGARSSLRGPARTFLGRASCIPGNR